MSRICISMAIVLLVGSAGQAQDKAKAPAGGVALTTTVQQASYGIGLSIGRDMKANAPDVDMKALTQGLADAFAGREPKLTEKQVSDALQAFQAEIQAKKKLAGQAFLAANKKMEGVITLESGLQYKVLKKGNGPKPKATDTVRTHYHGTLISGEVFDSSVERGEPISFSVGGVIRGWTEALQLMPVGSKWRLFVPSELAYGPRGAGEKIGPHATLIFDVELLAIE
ncbi:MAG: hypothetical protein CMJ64_24125 [Planctomycetaceae bacterium]|nr:hypothetical protein [Planctomycetaceae bacterium]